MQEQMQGQRQEQRQRPIRRSFASLWMTARNKQRQEQMQVQMQRQRQEQLQGSFAALRMTERIGGNSSSGRDDFLGGVEFVLA